MTAPHVLLVEDNAADRRLVVEMLRDSDVTLEEVDRLGAALERVTHDPFDCVLVDLSLPDATELEAVHHLRTAAPTLPIVVLSGHGDEERALTAVQAGAQDHLMKGQVDAVLLRRAIRYAIERKRTELQLAQLALHDPLTGLPNRRLFSDRLEQALARRDRSGGEVVVLFLDLDGFKAVNDTFGHDAGDELLQLLAGRLQLAVRASDTVARLGGDEFTILCEQVGGRKAALSIASRIAQTLEDPFEISDGEAIVHASIGVAASGRDGAAPGDLVKLADAAMYRAKAAGETVAVAEPDAESDPTV